DRLLPGWLRPDFWAVARIVDRTFQVYIRGQLLQALAVAVLTFAGLKLLKALGVEGVRYGLLLALRAGALNLIPTLGPILAAIPAVALGLATSPGPALAILALYVGVQQLEATVMAPRVESRSIDIHPVILVPVLVALSQFGFLWVLLGAPLAVV